MPPELANDERDLIKTPTSCSHCQFHTSPDSSPPLRSPFLSCSSSSSSEAGSPPEMPPYLWNYIHSPRSKKASSVKNVSTSIVTQPLSQKKSVGRSLSPQSLPLRVAVLALPREGTDPEPQGLPLLHPLTLVSRPLLGCSSKAMCPPRRKPPRSLHNPVHINLPKPGCQKSPSCHQGKH